ncbi:MAG: type II toxin-antitoxin system VapC family toxin [Methanophagales archaeon]|nr:type II toxin-antitoxin system VapC family toxin [Methanophagales archaeon]
MENLCIDTDILIDHLRGYPGTVEEMKSLEEIFHLSTTVVNSFELYYGASKTKRRKINILSVDKLLRRLLVLQMTEAASKLAGEILADLERKGEIIEFRDAFIASIAITHNTTLFTRNISHFERIEGLKLYE